MTRRKKTAIEFKEAAEERETAKADGMLLEAATLPQDSPIADFNGGGRLSVADLALLAGAHGKSGGDPDWETMSMFDLTRDGVIDIEDAAAAAGLILAFADEGR